MARQGNLSKAQITLSRIVNDRSALRMAPDVVAKACSELHGIYLKQRNATPQRERLVTDCAKRLPGDPVIVDVCEAEAVFWLKVGNVDKARAYYGLGGSGISKTGGSILALLSASTYEPISDRELRVLSDVTKALPEASEALFSLLAKRADGWKADYCKAMFLAESGKADAAVSVFDAMIRSRRGPEDHIRLAKAETLAFKSSRPKDALKAYRDWLRGNATSDLREKAAFQYGLLLSNCGLYADAVVQLETFAVQHPSGLYAKLATDTLAKAKSAQAGVVKREAEAVAKQERHNADPLLPRLEKGVKLQSERKYTLAAKEYQSFRGQANHDKWGKAWYNLGACLRQSGDTVRAIAAWNEVWSRSRLFTNTLYGVESRLASGDAYLEDAADADQAMACYEDVLKAKPLSASDPKFELNRAVCLLALGRSNEARAIFLKLRELAKGDTFKEFYWDGMVALCDGTPFQLIKTTAALDRRARTRMLLGDVFFASGESSKALRQYRSATWNASDPEVLAYCDMQAARCIAALGDADAALKEYEKLVGKYPKTVVADDSLLRMGVLWAGPKGNLRKAAECFARIVRDYPDSDTAEAAFIYLATTAWWSKQWGEAERLHKAFLEKYPTSPFCESIVNSRLPAIAKKSL